MPYGNADDYNSYMRRYYRKNADRINIRRAERKMWKQMVEDDERRGRASTALDALLANEDKNVVDKLYFLLHRCTPTMVEELVSRSTKLT